MTRHHTQAPFRRHKGAVERVTFHPTKPQFFVASQRTVRVYDLMAQSLVRTLRPGVRWIASLDVHAGGDHVLVGSYDKRVTWHDLDLSSAPYKTLRYHTRAVRKVAYSPRWPLFVTGADDGSLHVFHSTVYNDLVTPPLIVPLKRVGAAHEVQDGLGVLDVSWHPTEPWVVTVGADGHGRLWTP